MLGSLDCAVWE
uniref:Uncharacterized protein n=1 Tax=Arundo donax TaxID=35708 RepID=A0A0A8YNL8_ARUDO